MLENGYSILFPQESSNTFQYKRLPLNSKYPKQKTSDSTTIIMYKMYFFNALTAIDRPTKVGSSHFTYQMIDLMVENYIWARVKITNSTNVGQFHVF